MIKEGVKQGNFKFFATTNSSRFNFEAWHEGKMNMETKLSICWSFWPCYFWLKPAASGFNMLNYWLLIFFINFVFGRSWPEYNFDEAFLAGWGDNGRGNDETLRESVMKTCMTSWPYFWVKFRNVCVWVYGSSHFWKLFSSNFLKMALL